MRIEGVEGICLSACRRNPSVLSLIKAAYLRNFDVGCQIYKVNCRTLCPSAIYNSPERFRQYR